MSQLNAHGLASGYGRQGVFEGIELHIEAREIVGLVGPNGVGKTTLLRTLMGLNPAWSGAIELEGVHLERRPAYKRAIAGLAMVTQEKGLAPTLTAKENLQLALHYREDDAVLADMYLAMPKLREHRHVRAQDLSGGEQQFLAIARAVMMEPSVLLLDEPTLGLAPSVVDALEGLLRKVAERGVAILVAEQNVNFINNIADRSYHMTHGRLVPIDVTSLSSMKDFLGSPSEHDLDADSEKEAK